MATIGPKLQIDGYAEYKKNIDSLITQGKTLDSAMKLLESTWDKSTTAQEKAAGKAKILAQEIETQKAKVAQIAEVVAKATEKYGADSAEVQKWTQTQNKAQAELNKMQHELDDCNSALNEQQKELDDQQEELKQSTKEQKEHGKASDEAGEKAKKFGAAAKAAAAVAAAAFTAATAAAVTLGKAVVSQYADCEQLVGGVETLFKGSAEQVQDYANNAYKTAGMSANEYMETVTGFSASLISSLGGDTKKAAQYADMAITDMSDNANKMGSDMESIKNAYAGFAKGQYNMLDNLKLGYGGTKSEMERLVEDAEKLDSSFQASRDENGKLTLSYAEIVDAIHIVQTEMDITGTTAREAEQTISGSIASTKSAVQNLVTGLGTADADVEKLADDVISSFENVVDNITPVIENIAKSVPRVVTTISRSISKNKQKIVGLAKTVIKSAVSALKQILPEISDLLDDALDLIVDCAPDLVDIVLDLAKSIGQAIIKSAPKIIDSAFKIIEKVAQSLGKNAKKILTAVVDIIIKIGKQLIDNLPVLVKAVSQIVTGIVKALPSICVQIIKAIPSILISIGKAIVAGIGELISGLIDAVVGLFTGAGDEIEDEAEETAADLDRLAKTITEDEQKIIDKGFELKQQIDDLAEAREKSVGSIMTETGKYQDLWTELQNCVDANGKVKDGEKDRVKFIIGELNDGLGTEIRLNGDVVTSYKDIGKAIDEAIEKKQAYMLMQSFEDDYKAAQELLSESPTAISDALGEFDKYNDWLSSINQFNGWAGKSAPEFIAELERVSGSTNAASIYDSMDLSQIPDDDYFGQLYKRAQAWKSAIDADKAAHETSAQYWDMYRAYMDADYKQVVKIGTQKTSYMWSQVKSIKDLNEADRAQLTSDLRQKLDYINNVYIPQMRAGVAGYTQEGLAEEQAAIQHMLNLWLEGYGIACNEARKHGEELPGILDDGIYIGARKAGFRKAGGEMVVEVLSGMDETVSDAEQQGEKIGTATASGIKKGMKEMAAKVAGVAGSVMQTVLDTMKFVAKINSPSKVTAGFGMGLGEGLIKGMDKIGPMVDLAAEKFMGSTLSAMRPASFQLPDPAAYGGQTNNYNRSIAAGAVTVQVHAAPGQSAESIADAVMDKINRAINSESAVWA